MFCEIKRWAWELTFLPWSVNCKEGSKQPICLWSSIKQLSLFMGQQGYHCNKISLFLRANKGRPHNGSFCPGITTAERVQNIPETAFIKRVKNAGMVWRCITCWDASLRMDILSPFMVQWQESSKTSKCLHHSEDREEISAWSSEAEQTPQSICLVTDCDQQGIIKRHQVPNKSPNGWNLSWLIQNHQLSWNFQQPSHFQVVSTDVKFSLEWSPEVTAMKKIGDANIEGSSLHSFIWNSGPSWASIELDLVPLEISSQQLPGSLLNGTKKKPEVATNEKDQSSTLHDLLQCSGSDRLGCREHN